MCGDYFCLLYYSDPNTQEQAPISVDLLPRQVLNYQVSKALWECCDCIFAACRCESCGGLLRPHVVWYGEGMEYDTLAKIDLALRNCDLYIQVSRLRVCRIFPQRAK